MLTKLARIRAKTLLPLIRKRLFVLLLWIITPTTFTNDEARLPIAVFQLKIDIDKFLVILSRKFARILSPSIST